MFFQYQNNHFRRILEICANFNGDPLRSYTHGCGRALEGFFYSQNFYIAGLRTQNQFFIFLTLFINDRYDLKNLCWIQAVFSYVDDIESSPSLTSNGGEEVKSHVQIMNCSVFQSDIRTLKKPADGAKDVSYSLAEMFGIPDEYDACAEITLNGFNFKIKGLHREHQHTCKSTGLMLWESAHLMSSVEFGVAKFADLVVATNGDSESLNLLHQNINSNLEPSILDKLHCLKLEWGNADHINAVKELSPEGFDVLIGIDVTHVIGGPPPAFILCHVFCRVDEASIISSASSLGFGLGDNWPFTHSSSNSSNVGSSRGTIGSWFSQEGSCKRNSHTTALRIM
ncbi:hypothetical protein AMTRI_Chr05g61740 [Amborella trichopoda]